MVVTDFDAVLATAPQAGETWRIKWYYRDPDGSIVVPTSLTNNSSLYDSAGLQRDPTNTANTGAYPFTPTQDVDNGFYVDVAFHSAAATGFWYVTTTYTHEGAKTQNLGFLVTSAGALVGTPGLVSGGGPLYCSVADVTRFMTRNVLPFDENTLLTKTDVEEIILQQMEFVDQFCQTTWRARTISLELQDVVYSDKWRWHGDYIATTRTTHRPVQNIAKLEVVKGGTYTDITSPEDRQTTWYADKATGEVFIVGTHFPSVNRKSVRITYTWGHVQIPHTVKEATLRLAAAYIMEGEAFAVDTPETSILGTLDARIDRWQRRAMEILDREKRLVYAAQGG